MKIDLSKADKAVCAWVLAQRKAANPPGPADIDALCTAAFDECVLTPWRAKYGAAMVTEARTVIESADPITVAEKLPAIKTLLEE